MHLNILHRTDPGPLYEICRLEQQWVREFGLQATLFLHYEDLFDTKVLKDAEGDAAAGDELGLALHRLRGPEINTGGANQFWLLDAARKRDVLEIILGRWRSLFGADPVSVSCYHLDASSMRLLRELSPGTKIVVGGCFEEGVRVFHGCNHSWYLFNEGMPWGPWYPAKDHALRPARDEADAVGLIAVPHLVRDMALSYEGRNDFWATHPPNVIRGMGNEATWSPYDLNLIDQYRMQEDHSPHPAYVNTFVSAPWLTWNHNSEYPPEVAQELYRKQLAYFAKLRDAGELQCLTLADYAQWFAAHRKTGEAEVFHAKEVLYGSGKHYLWYLDSAYRVLFDCAQGGSIGDLRPYVGKVAMDTGPDTPNHAIGSYPYLIQSQHRTGSRHHCHDGARTTLKICHEGETLDLCDFSTRCERVERSPEAVSFHLAPITLCFRSGLAFDLSTVITCSKDGRIRLDRKVSTFSDESAEVTVEEYIKACWGLTEYPEDLAPVVLEVDGAEPNRRNFAYRGESITTKSCGGVRATVPPTGTKLSLEPGDGWSSPQGKAREGHLFEPYFTLSVTASVQSSAQFSTWITLTPIAP
jgi:hypothetical protein